MRFLIFPALPMDRGTGRRKRKTPLIPQRDIRGDVIAVPLSFLACRTGNEVHSGGITRRAPGRTSRLPAAGPLSAGEGPSLFFGANATLPFTAPYETLYYHPSPAVSSLEKNFGGFPRGNLGLTGFYPGFLAKRGEGLYDERKFKGNFCRLLFLRFSSGEGVPEGGDEGAGFGHLVGREKVNCPAGAREAGLGHDSARRFAGFRPAGRVPFPRGKGTKRR